MEEPEVAAVGVEVQQEDLDQQALADRAGAGLAIKVRAEGEVMELPPQVADPEEEQEEQTARGTEEAPALTAGAGAAGLTGLLIFPNSSSVLGGGEAGVGLSPPQGTG